MHGQASTPWTASSLHLRSRGQTTYIRLCGSALREAIGIRRTLRRIKSEAVSRSLRGLDVVMESPTASGKTLAFGVPMLDAIVRNQSARTPS